MCLAYSSTSVSALVSPIRLPLNQVLLTAQHLCSVLTHSGASTVLTVLLVHDVAKIQMYCCCNSSAVPADSILLIFNH